MYTEAEYRQIQERWSRTLGHILEPGEDLYFKPETVPSLYFPGDTITSMSRR